MKSILLAGISLTVLAFQAHAGDYNQYKAWGVSPGSGGSAGRVIVHESLGRVAGQVQDERNLTAQPIVNNITNTACGVCNTTNVEGSNNNVSVVGGNSGSTGADQSVGSIRIVRD